MNFAGTETTAPVAGDAAAVQAGGVNLRASIRAWARGMKRDVIALWLAARHPRLAWYVKALAGAVAAYALSPIDLIPDFVPILGYVDDLIIVPAGLWLAVRLIPAPLMAEFRDEAMRRDRPVSRGGLLFIIFAWVILAAGGAWLILR